ncbi:hypothetical protein BGX28_004908 [Mortierella sp. GBA30]|nr:hypothetical protein BGX28_004908 [Mortierella sp. GBA30]
MHAIEKDYSNVRVYAKHLQSATIVHQACIGDWTHQNVAMSPGGESIDHFDVVFGKGTYLSLYRFLGDEADIGRPTGTLEHIHEQPVFGTIKDIKTLFCSFEEAEDGTGMDMDIDQQQDIPRLGYIPKASSSTVLVVTSDSGVLSFLTFHYNGTTEGIGNSGYFRVLKEISNIDLKGTIIDMEFLTPDPDDEEENAILAVLFYNKDTSKYHIATFHIGLKERMESHLAVQVGTSQLASNPTKSVLLLKALPNLPCSMVYIDTLYLGSDTSELYRINIHHLTYSMQFELISGERPVGNVMLVLARRQTTIETPMSDAGQDIVFNTDYVLYSSDQGDGGILAVKEEEGGIDLFAITELQNSSPILDFCIQEPTFPGRDSLYICSGMKQEGSIKRIRSGIPAESSGSGGNEFFAGTTGLWSIKENQQDVFDSFLVVSFVQSTTLMKTGDGGSLEDISENSGLDLKQATVGAGRLKDGTVFQAHRNGVIAVDLQHVVASKSLDAEPTAIHCWREESNSVELDDQGEKLTDVLCCVGTLEPAVLVFKITPDAVRDVYRESLGIDELSVIRT